MLSPTQPIARKFAPIVAVLCVFSLFGLCRELNASGPTELLRYEISWNGSKAGHGDITAKREANQVMVTVQAVSDGVLKKIIEAWSRVQATFAAKTFQPKKYDFAFRSNLGDPELVALTFDHDKSMVQVSKQRGTECENHQEKCSALYDPITATYLLRSQKDLTKPLFVDIYDGKDKARLFVTPAGQGPVQIKKGAHQAFRLDLRLVKLGGDKKEIATGKLWISNDEHRIPLLLTSSPIVGTIRCELVDSQL
ncbi:MAG: DUF3108 domain-containing protein [Desulfomonile tiedjei]|nr:DUF3108 domain-containing protein [Desulfomonile tiedjei]